MEHAGVGFISSCFSPVAAVKDTRGFFSGFVGLSSLSDKKHSLKSCIMIDKGQLTNTPLTAVYVTYFP